MLTENNPSTNEPTRRTNFPNFETKISELKA